MAVVVGGMGRGRGRERECGTVCESDNVAGLTLTTDSSSFQAVAMPIPAKAHSLGMSSPQRAKSANICSSPKVLSALCRSEKE